MQSKRNCHAQCWHGDLPGTLLAQAASGGHAAMNRVNNNVIQHELNDRSSCWKSISPGPIPPADGQDKDTEAPDQQQAGKGAEEGVDAQAASALGGRGW